MPGINELEYFREELSKLGNEREVTEERGETYEPFPPPSSVADSISTMDVDNLLASIDEGGSAPPSGKNGEVQDIPDAPEEPEATQDANRSEFDSVLESLNLDGDTPPANLDDPSEEPGVDDFDLPEIGSEELSPEDGDTSLESYDESPDSSESIDPIAGLDALLAAGLPETDEESTNSFELPADFELPSFDDSPLVDTPPIESPPEVEDVPSIDEIPDIDDVPFIDDVPESADDVSVGEIPDMDFPSDDPAVPGDTDDIAEMDLTPQSADLPSIAGDSSDLSAFNEGASPEKAGLSIDMDDFSNFPIPDDLPIPEEAENDPAEDSSVDGFDGFSLDDDILHTTSSEEDEFHIPGFSDFAEGTSFDGLDELTGIPSTRKSSKKEIPLEISETDFTRFLDFLAQYPLNLRMAVEEYISEGAGSELQKMEIVHHILEETPLKRVARIMEDRLNRSIPIPKDFEKKTAAEYEQEKASLKYLIINKILPAAILFTGISIITACVIFLSWQFVYRPIAAERLYKRGYAAIEDARYTQSTNLFDQAVLVWNKKKWYFRYARAYRDKKQFIAAETMYERLLNRFKNDRKAGLEYAEMLRTDLRNFEKAETVLRRRVLDNYVNDPEGMMLLGDTYLDWGDEVPVKYEDAKAMYAALIDLYGSKDPYLARMMRYFIRTDKLGEVLPLKDHFVSKRKIALDAPDLVELSGYLLDKRYTPNPGDSEQLRSFIDDVRSLLEKAVEAGPEIPEAHYNMGRFFIHNNMPDQASTALSGSLKLFETSTPMSPKRVMTRVDAYRLLGELRADDKEYLRAQGLYAQGMSLYEQQRKNRSVNQDSRVGRLYADSADIDYFISNDLATAKIRYTRALEELYDNPSIRYRIGYINYQDQEYEAAMQQFNRAYAENQDDKNIRFSFANTLFRRGNLFASQGHYERLMESLEAERLRKGLVFPQTRTDHGAFVEQYMKTSNNLGVTLNRLARRTGDSGKNSRALALLSESTRAWDSLTRNPETLVRAAGANLAFMNIQNMTHPRAEFVPELYTDIPKTLEGEPVLRQREDR